MTAGSRLPLDNDGLAIDAALGPIAQYAGHRVVELGEDGEEWLVDGHPDDDATLAAVNAYALAMGYGEFTLEFTLDDVEITRRWSAFLPHRDGCDDDACEPCRQGRHDECSGGQDADACECSHNDHVWFCSCDEYLWFTDYKPQAQLLARPNPAYHAVTVVER